MPWVAGADLTAADLNLYLPQVWTAWVPTVTSVAGSFTAVSGSGRYVKFGNGLVVWQANIIITTVGTASGGVIFTLPVNSANASRALGSGRENQTTGNMLQVATYAATVDRGLIMRYDNAAPIAAGYVLAVGGTYEGA